MKRLTVAATLSTSASAFQCLARSSNGVKTCYGLIFERASAFAIRHCRVAGGVNCHIAFCRCLQFAIIDPGRRDWGFKDGKWGEGRSGRTREER